MKILPTFYPKGYYKVSTQGYLDLSDGRSSNVVTKGKHVQQTQLILKRNTRLTNEDILNLFSYRSF